MLNALLIRWLIGWSGCLFWLFVGMSACYGAWWIGLDWTECTRYPEKRKDAAESFFVLSSGHYRICPFEFTN